MGFFFQIHSFVSAALLITTTKPSYYVDFREKHATTSSSFITDDNSFSLIVGLRIESLVDSSKKIQVGFELHY